MLKKCSSLHFFVFPARFQSKQLSETEIYPPPVRSLQWSTFLFSESFMFAAPPEACQDSYIRHLQRGSLCPSHVTGEHAEVMHIDRARSDLTQKPTRQPGFLSPLWKCLSSEDKTQRESQFQRRWTARVKWDRRAVRADGRWCFICMQCVWGEAEMFHLICLTFLFSKQRQPLCIHHMLLWRRHTSLHVDLNMNMTDTSSTFRSFWLHSLKVNK